MPINKAPPNSSERHLIVLECLLSLTIVFLFAGSLPPGINESHYLPKAKHVWDSSFASGSDIFLQSNDSHFLASLLAGLLAKCFEFASVAWMSRFLAWLLFSIAWFRLCRAVQLPSLLRPLVLVCWLLLGRYGHLAGEWVVGGFEAKSIAYPLAMFGLASVLENRWSAAWVWLGAATAFQPVVGGWIGINAAAVWLFLPIDRSQRRAQFKSLLIGFLLALVGAWPAIMGFGSPDREGTISAAQVHVFFRLAHHLCPRTFDPERWLAAGLVIVAFFVLAATSLRQLAKCTQTVPQSLAAKVQVVLATPLGKLIGIAVISMLISFIGWSVDQLGVLTGREDVSAALLRFYWFRWSDVAVPLATAMLVGRLLAQWCYTSGGSTTTDVTPTGSVLLACALVVTGLLGIWHWQRESQQIVPPADRWMVQQPGPFPVNWDNLPSADDPGLPKRYIDWLAVCEWIKQNSPSDSLWITPKHQQSFKWYAQRAEVVSWKDVPQDNRSIIEWYRRIERLSPRRNSQGKVRGWETEELIALAKEYQCNWILIDRTYQDKPPLLECKYPINIDNRSFAVFFVPEAMLNRK